MCRAHIFLSTQQFWCDWSDFPRYSNIWGSHADWLQLLRKWDQTPEIQKLDPKNEPLKFVKSSDFTSFLILTFLSHSRENSAWFLHLHSTFQKHFWSHYFATLEGAWDQGVHQQQGVTQQREAVFGYKPASHGSSEQAVISVRVQSRCLGMTKWQPVLVQHLPPLSVSHVCLHGTILSAGGHREWISPRDPFPSWQQRIPLLPLPRLTARLAPVCVFLQTSATSRGDQRFGKPPAEDGTVVFYTSYTLYTKMMWWCAVSLCTALSPPNSTSGWFGSVLWDKMAVGLGTDWLCRSRMLRDIPTCGLNVWGCKGW